MTGGLRTQATRCSALTQVACPHVEATDAVAVVAVVLIENDDPNLSVSLRAFNDQSYADLQWVFLVAPSAHEGQPDGLSATVRRIRDVVPGAVVRPVDAGVTSRAEAMNTVVDIVEGARGLFWFCNAGTVPDPDALDHLVTEMQRSNAGIVGPKFVQATEPSRLLSVGAGADRFGSLRSATEPGEVDQEQHDAVRDVFVLSNDSLLIRADLFHEIGGFTPHTDGDDLDVCWRAHLAGARVVVVPDAVVAHRMPDQLAIIADPMRSAERRRVDTVLALTASARLPGRITQMVLLAIIEMVVGLFTGRAAAAWRSAAALVSAPLRLGAVRSRRRRTAPVRMVSDWEVLGLMDRGTVRLGRYLRARDTAEYVGATTTERRWRERSYGPGLAWAGIVLGLVVGAREIITSGLPLVGSFSAWPSDAGEAIARFGSAWEPSGVGSTRVAPTISVLMGLVDTAMAFHEGLAATVWVLGAVLVGAAGMWRLSQVFPSNRARIAALVVYASTPVATAAIGDGRLAVLALHAGLPWAIHHGRRLAGISTASPDTAEGDLPDGLIVVERARRIRSAALLAMVAAIAAACAPVALTVIVASLVLVACASLIVAARCRVAAWFGAAAVIAGVGGWALNLPWSLTWDAATLGGGGQLADGIDSLSAIAPADTGGGLSLLALALFFPVVASVAFTRAWRLTWAVRGAVLVLVPVAVLVFAPSTVGGWMLPGRWLLMVPVVAGCALCAAAVAGSFGIDVASRRFGWRQPTALLANLSIIVGVVPGVLAVGPGDFSAPKNTLAELVATQFPARSDDGSYRVLYLGDPRLLPLPGHEISDGLAMVITDAGPVSSALVPIATESSETVEYVRAVLADVAAGTTTRLGRLLAPLGIRYIAVPLADGVHVDVGSTTSAPVGLDQGLARQIDVTAVQSPPTLDVYVNRAWIPPAAFLTGTAAEASTRAGAASLVVDEVDGVAAIVDPRGSAVDLVDVVAQRGGTATVVPGAGVVHLAVPVDDAWEVRLDGEILEVRAGFGVTTALDIPRAGSLTIGYSTPIVRWVWIVVWAGLWLGAIAATMRPSVGGGRARSHQSLAAEHVVQVAPHE